MRVDLIELLRCPASHALTPLVTVANQRDGESLIDGMLGCPVCGAEFTLHDGLVRLGDPVVPSHDAARAVDAERTAALLGVSLPEQRVVLCGAYASVAAQIAGETGAQCLVVNAPRRATLGRAIDQLALGPAARWPLANASCHGVAVDPAHVALLTDVARIVRPGGRVVAPVAAPVPVGCRELARDAQEWVAEVESVSAPVTLRYSPPPS